MPRTSRSPVSLKLFTSGTAGKPLDLLHRLHWSGCGTHYIGLKLTLAICSDLLVPSYSLASTLSADLHSTTWTHEWIQLHCMAFIALTPNWLTQLQCTELNWLNRTDFPCTTSFPFLLKSFSFLCCSQESWVYHMSDSFCEIFSWSITSSDPQLDVTFKHGCFFL